MEEFKAVNQKEERPTFLLVICILSWISIGFAFFGTVWRLLRGPLSSEVMNESKIEILNLVAEMRTNHMDSFADFFDKTIQMSEVYNNNHYSYYLMVLITLLVGGYGVYNMFIGKKIGFHLYIVYSILGSLIFYIFMPAIMVPNLLVMWSVFFSLMFIFMYAANLKWLK
jgi:hypothetical protein